MTQDRPDIADLLATVQAFVERITPKLAGEDRYHAQVAAFLLAICGREIAVPAGAAEIERRMLADFLGREGELPELTATQ